jgi:hypothetical protein
LPPFEFFSGYGDLDLGSFFICVSYRLVLCRVCCSVELSLLRFDDGLRGHLLLSPGMLTPKSTAQ